MRNTFKYRPPSEGGGNQSTEKRWERKKSRGLPLLLLDPRGSERKGNSASVHHARMDVSATLEEHIWVATQGRLLQGCVEICIIRAHEETCGWEIPMIQSVTRD